MFNITVTTPAVIIMTSNINITEGNKLWYLFSTRVNVCS